MAPGGPNDPIHPEATRRSGYHYFFYSKHHGGGSRGDAQWRPDLSHEEEFSIFDAADWHEIADERGWLYGILRNKKGQVQYIGTWEQQIGVFQPGQEWHGYPLYPADKRKAPPNRRGDKVKPPKEVFLKWEQAGLLSTREWKRLFRGKNI